jgi:hypothetical protein
MNVYLAAAGILAFFVGLVHSVLGEHMIFRRMRQGGLIPTDGGRLLGEGHVRILWASWHIVTVLGWSMALVLFRLSLSPSPPDAFHVFIADVFIADVIAAAMLLGSAFVFVGTKARHPGWIGLLGVAVLTWMGRSG